MPRLTRARIEALRPSLEEFSVWDSEIGGLGLRVRPSGVMSFVLVHRLDGRLRKHTLGRCGPDYDLAQARHDALEIKHASRHPPGLRPGSRAAAASLTVGGLIDFYLSEGPAMKPNKKASSWATDRSVLECHVRPLLGPRLASSLTRAEVARFQQDVASGLTARDVKLGPRARSIVTGGRTVAALATATLGAAYAFAVALERLPSNPTKGVQRFSGVRRERFLSEREVAALGAALEIMESRDPSQGVMADAVRLLILTGCRKTEILSLRWEWVDWRNGCLRLPDSKTGARIVPCADVALRLLRRRWEADAGRGSPYVLPAMKGDGHLVGLPRAWARAKALADAVAFQQATALGEDAHRLRSLADVRLHDLRHSFASFAIADGASLFMVGKALGHRQTRTTEIYAHLSDDPLRRLADQTGARIAGAMKLS